MKQVLFFLAIVSLLSVPLTAQTPEPLVVRKNFETLYPEAAAPVWTHQAHGNLVAIFQHDRGLKKAFFTETGRWLETRLRMTVEHLPEGVQEFIRLNYSGAEITFCGRIYNENGAWFRVESEYSDRLVLINLDWFGELIAEQEFFYESMMQYSEDGNFVIPPSPLQNHTDLN